MDQDSDDQNILKYKSKIIIPSHVFPNFMILYLWYVMNKYFKKPVGVDGKCIVTKR